MKRYLAIMIFVIPMLGYSITNETAKNSANYSLYEDDPKMTGYTDANGKQGYWIIYGKDAPEKGYPSEGKIEEGNYKDDNKIGVWIFYHADGVTPRTKGNFVDNRPNGAYEKFSTEGVMIEKGSFHNKKQLGDFKLWDKDGNLTVQKTFNAEGKEDGAIIHYYASGQIQYSLTKVNGVPTGEAIRYWEDGSVKSITIFNPDGTVKSETIVNAEPLTAPKVDSGSGGPDGSDGIIKDGKEFNCRGYNKIYNKADEIWMDGTFKDCKLWDGKLYKYDSDGILLKFEVWKDGAYHSDGQLSK